MPYAASMKKLLLGSGGIRTAERLEAWKNEAGDFLKGVSEVVFIPYAGNDHASYTQRTVELDIHPGKKVVGLHTFPDPVKAIEEAQCVSVGGGNTFRLLATMQRLGLLPVIRRRALAGMPYVGISAGTNVACPTIKTTNDMPIVVPAGLDALGLVRFQINPHFFPGTVHYYEGAKLEKYAGETREDRIREFHEMNATPVLGLFEGSVLRVENEIMALKGVGGARLFEKNTPPKDIAVGSTVTIVA